MSNKSRLLCNNLVLCALKKKKKEKILIHNNTNRLINIMTGGFNLSNN